MKVVVFDTETTSLEKPFCYNIGYIITETETGEILLKKDFVCEQVWHNPMLFTTAYYADKRPIYVERMRARKTIMNKFGYICQEMIRDFKAFGVEKAFAFNSDFDEKVFNFNCDWFKCNNPFDNVLISDIRGFVHNYLVDDNFKAFCDYYGYYTETGNYSTTAETVFRYIINSNNFNEEHTALSDSEIECAILMKCLRMGADINENYKAFRSIPKQTKKIFTVKNGNTKEIVFECECYNIMYKKSNNTIIVK